MRKTDVDILPSLFAVSIGGYTGVSYSVEKSGDCLLYGCFDYGYELKTIETITPSSTQWKTFMQTLDKIGVCNWWSEYVDYDILDGTSWSVKIHWKNKSISSQGNSSYSGGNYDSSEFKAFIRAVRRLLGGKKFA